MQADPHQPLRDDVRLLGELLGQVLKDHEGEGLSDRVEQVRGAAKRERGSDAESALDAVAELLQSMPIESTFTVARAFAHFLNLANIAEQHHRPAPPTGLCARAPRQAATGLVRRNLCAPAPRHSR